MLLPSSGEIAWTVIGPDRRPVADVDEFLAWLTNIERSVNTVEAYARDLKTYFEFLVFRKIQWQEVGIAELGEFAAWARQPADNVFVVSEASARRSAASVNRMLTAVIGFYEFHGRRGNALATQLVVQTRSGSGGFKPMLHGLGRRQRKRGVAVRLPEQERRPKTLSLDQVSAIVESQQHLRDRFFFALLASTGMRVGQALSLRHQDIISWERRIEIVGRRDDRARARSKGGASGSIPIPGELVKLWNDYMHEEFKSVDSEFVFVNLFADPIGHRMTYASVDRLVRRTRRKVGFYFTPHQLRHTFATLAFRDGVQLDVIGALLTHKSPSSTLVYTHPTAEDLRRALAERGVLDKVSDLIS